MKGWFIENHIAELSLRMANAYKIGNISRARRFEKELADYKEKPYVKVYLLTKGK